MRGVLGCGGPAVAKRPCPGRGSLEDESTNWTDRGSLPASNVRDERDHWFCRHLGGSDIPGLGVGIAAIGVRGGHRDREGTDTGIPMDRGLVGRSPAVAKRPDPRDRRVGGGIDELHGQRCGPARDIRGKQCYRRRCAGCGRQEYERDDQGKRSHRVVRFMVFIWILNHGIHPGIKVCWAGPFR